MEKRLIESKEEYVSFWKNANASILQSWNWGEVKKDQWKVLRYSINNYPVQLFLKRIPITGKYFGYIPRPFLGIKPDQDILSGLKSIVTEQNLSHLIIDPHVLEEESQVFDQNGFKQIGKTIQPNQTNYIEIAAEKDPWMAMSGKYRRNIKKSQRDECKIEIHSEGSAPVERFYKVMEEVFARTSYVMYGLSYFQKVWNELSKDGNARIYLSTKDGKDVGAYLVAFDNTFAYELYGGVTDAGRNVEAGYLLKWEAIKDAKEMGKLYYDHWGIAPYDENGYDKSHELYNISKFKEGFGGVKVKYAKQYGLINDQLSYTIYTLGIVFNNIMLKLKKLF